MGRVAAVCALRHAREARRQHSDRPERRAANGRRISGMCTRKRVMILEMRVKIKRQLGDCRRPI